MNRHLELLLSKAYPGALAPAHLEDLRASGLTDETIHAQSIRSVPPAMIAPLLGFDLDGVQSALLFPFPAPTGGFMDHVRLKIFPALKDKDGHRTRYLQPRGVPPHVYFVAGCLRAVLHQDEPLWIVEGEKKALCVAQLGYPAIGICGVDGWHTKGSRELLPDFNDIGLHDRVVEVLPDGDYDTNPAVARAIRRLADALRARGARPRLVRLPSPDRASS